MTQLNLIENAIAKLEATVDDAKAPEPGESNNALAKPQSTRSVRANKDAPVKLKPAKAKASAQPRSFKPPRSKKAVLRSLVERRSGATMSAMMEATGWQAHSVRAGLTGLCKAGFDLERRTNRKGETVYVVAHTAAPQ